MSESENVDMEQYRTTNGVEERTVDISSDEHALKQEFGDDKDALKMEYDASIAGERFVQFYEDQAASIREYLSNAETACIRRAEAILRENGHSIPEETTDTLEAAEEKCGYEPIIEVTYNEKEEEDRFIIQDNGIGISIEEYKVLKKVGYSTSHQDGTRLGQFGMGYLSGFQLVGTNGCFKMMTKSYNTEVAYSTINYLDDMLALDKIPQSYGTTFVFPEFCERAKNIDIHEKVSEFAQGMRVPVLYRHFDEDGQETQHSDDYLPYPMEDDYEDDDVTIVFEDEYFKAVASPESPQGRSYITYNVTVPIRRNEPGWGTNSALNAPWKWDFRAKREDGPVVRGPNEGLSPISENKYNNMTEERKKKFIPRVELTDDDIVMPAPSSSRDSFEDGHDDFWYYVSDVLAEQWRQEAKRIVEDVDDFDDYLDRSAKEQNTILMAYQRFGPGKSANGDSIEKRLSDNLDADVNGEAFARISHVSASVNVFPNSNHRALKSNCSGRQIIDLLQRDGDVYIGQTLSDKKAAMVYDLSDSNAVVQCSTDKYDEYQKLFGWKLLKELPSRNLSEKLPELSDEFIEEWEGKSDDSKSSRQQSLNPATRKIDIEGERSVSGRAGNIRDKLDDGGISRYGGTIENLVVYDTNNEYAKTQYSNSNTSVAEVPRYVYEYLLESDNVYTEEEMREKHNSYMVGGKAISEYDESHAFLFLSDELEEWVDDVNTLKNYLPDHISEDVESVSVLNSSEVEKFSFADIDAHFVKSKNIRVNIYAESFTEHDAQIVLEEELSDVDQSCTEFSRVFGTYPKNIDDAFLNLVETVKAAGGFQKA